MSKFILKVILDLNKNSIKNKNNISIILIIVIRIDNTLEYIFLRNKFREYKITLKMISIYTHY